MFFIHLLKEGSTTKWGLTMSSAPIRGLLRSNHIIPIEPTTHTEDLTKFLGVFTEECNAIFEVICAILNSPIATSLSKDSIIEQIELLKTQNSHRVMTLINLSP